MSKRPWIFGALLVAVVCLLPATVSAGKGPCDEEADVCVTQMLDKIRKKGWVGIELDWPDGGGPPTVTKVIGGSPASEAGLEGGDVLVAMNGITYSDHNSKKVMKAYKGLTPGEIVTYTVSRRGSETEVDVVLGHVPDQIAAQWIGNHVIHHHTQESDPDEVVVGQKD